MFKNRNLRKERDELTAQIDQLKNELSELKIKHHEELAQIKHERKLADEDIKHLVKIKQEASEITLTKREVELEREKQIEIGKVKDEYRDKLEEQLKSETERITVMYGEILQRLPNVNMRMKG